MPPTYPKFTPPDSKYKSGKVVKKQKTGDSSAIVRRQSMSNPFLSRKKLFKSANQSQTMVAKRGRVYSSRSGGFLKSKKRVKKTAAGSCITTERGGLLDTRIGTEAGPTVFVGHCDAPTETMFNLVCREIIRNLLIKIGVNITGLDDLLPIAGGTPSIFIVVGRDNSQPGTLPTSFNFNILSTDTLSDLGVKLRNLLVAKNDQYIIDYVAYEPVGVTWPRTEMQLSKSTLEVYSKSSLKIQNRTTETILDDDADDVDNVPLYGKSYEGKGNGCTHLNQFGPVNFYADEQFGDIWKQDTRFNNGNLYIREPPRPQEFKKVVKHGKARVEPGQIKTSVLTTKRSFLVQTLIQHLIDATQDGSAFDSHQQTYFGKFRLFCFEKMIQIKSVSDDSGLKLAYEVNNFTQATLHTKSSRVTCSQVRVGNVNTTIL